MRKVMWVIIVVLTIFVIALIGSSFYLLDLALAPDPNRRDVDSCYNQQFITYPESKEWIDNLNQTNAFRDTFVVMPSGEKHHAFFC